MRQTSAPIRRAVESLEPRRLLHGEFDVTFNFQPEGSALSPDTVADYGYVYGDRGNGYAYGWNVDSRGILRDRDKTADQRLDTVAQLQQNGGSHVWELEIPNGQYEVTLTAGDSKYLDGEHHIDAEGTRVMYGVQSTKKQFLKSTNIIAVQDGRLTISPESSGVNSKLISVAVKSHHDGIEFDEREAVSLQAMTDTVVYEGGTDTVATFKISRPYLDLGELTLTHREVTVYFDWSGSASTKDFRGRPNSVTIPALGEGYVLLNVVGKTDELTEGDEVAKLRILPNPTYRIDSPSTAVVIVKDGSNVPVLEPVPPEVPTKPTVSVVASDGSASEDGDEGEYRLTRDVTNGALTVNWTWSSLAAGADYQIGRVNLSTGATTFAARTNSITFDNGVGEIRLRLRPTNDTLVEGNENATLNLTAASAYAVSTANPKASILITDNDGQYGLSTITVAGIADAIEGGQPGSFRFTRTNGDIANPLVVALDWQGSASSLDVNRPSTVTFAAGAATANLSITAINDTLAESDETATVFIGSGNYVQGSPGQASILIHDNDAPNPGTFTNINWSTTSSPPVVFSETTSAVVNNQLYLFGGFNGVFQPQKNVYRFNGTTWTRMNDAPVAFTHVGSTEVDGKVWFAGGYIGKTTGGQTFGTTDVRIYDPSNDTWSAGPSLPSARASGNLQRVGRKLYFFGGEVANRASDSTSMWALDLDNQAAGWVAKASMPMARNHVPAVVSNGKIIVLGGQTGYDGNLVARDDIQLYDIASNTWSVSSKKLPGARSHTVSSTLLYQGKIIMIGGESAHDVPQKNVWSIDPSTLVTTALNNFPIERFSAAVGVVNGKLYVIGGYRGGIATQGYVGTFV